MCKVLLQLVDNEGDDLAPVCEHLLEIFVIGRNPLMTLFLKEVIQGSGFLQLRRLAIQDPHYLKPLLQRRHESAIFHE